MPWLQSKEEFCFFLLLCDWVTPWRDIALKIHPELELVRQKFMALKEILM